MNDHGIASSERDTRIPVDLSQPLDLEIRSSHGNIAIRGADRPDVLVAAGRLTGFGGVEDDESAVTIEARGNRIEVRPHPRAGDGWAGFGASFDFDLDNVVGQVARAFRGEGAVFPGKPGRGRIGFGGPDWADVEIEIPRSMTARVAVHAASGDVRIEDVAGEIAVKTMSGDHRIKRVRGDLTLHAASGDMTIEEASGSLNAHAASGDIRVGAGEMEGVQIQTASGDVSLDATLSGNGPFGVKTASGDVRLALRVPATAGAQPCATLAFQTIAGDAHVAPPLRKSGRRRWQSGNEEGGPHIDVATVNGDLTASLAATRATAGPAPSPAVFPAVAPETLPAPADHRPQRGDASNGADAQPQAEQPPAVDATGRLAVLEAVERGEIDIEEALRRLDASDVGVTS